MLVESFGFGTSGAAAKTQIRDDLLCLHELLLVSMGTFISSLLHSLPHVTDDKKVNNALHYLAVQELL